MAIENQVPIVPVVFLDNYKRLEGGNLWFGKCGPGQSRMVVLNPISTEGLNNSDISNLMKHAFEEINACLEEYIPSLFSKPYVQLLYIEYYKLKVKIKWYRNNYK